MTARISSLLIAESVDSIDQIINVDSVLLSIRTGLAFKFILHLGSQAGIVNYVEFFVFILLKYKAKK